MSNYICVQCINIFKDLSEKDKDKVVSFFRKEEYEKGETIFTPYEDFKNFYMVNSGKVLLYEVSAEGKKIIIDILKAGDIFFNFSLMFDSSAELTDFASVTEGSEIYKMDKDDFFEIISKYPKVALNVIGELSRKLNEADSRMRDLALNNATIRIINELLRLSKKSGEGLEDNKVKISIRLTHEELAEMIGTSRETATKILKKLRKLSFINLAKDRHIILNTNKIKEFI